MALKVFYLDDEPDLCENFAEYFASSEVEITTFVDAGTAIDAILKTPPDLLFIDYRLVGTTGDDVAKTLRPKFPVFLVTGDVSVKTEFQFARIFSKPYRELEITEAIRSFLSADGKQG